MSTDLDAAKAVPASPVEVDFDLDPINRKLMDAAAEGTVELVRAAVSEGANPAVRGVYNDDMNTPVLVAVDKNEDQAVAAYLIELGLDSVFTPDSGPLLQCLPSALAFRGWTDLLEAVIQRGADVDGKDRFGQTALIVASERGDLLMIGTLLQNGADINALGGLTHTALSYAKTPAAAQALLDAGADMEIENDEGRTPLLVAAENGFSELATTLITAGAQLAARDNFGDNALTIAIGSGNSVVVAALLDAGFDVDLPGKYETTPLMFAVKCGEDDIVADLIRRGASLDEQDDDSRNTALLWSVLSTEAVAMTLLLEAGADRSIRNDKGDDLESLLVDRPVMQAAFTAWRARSAMRAASTRVAP